jgi:cellulose synthase/poly-beta-1,6-N-acetylglucosamine synthase-like glycosyltransferase
VIANGNSTNPLDNTEEICRTYGVNHIWCPVGSKIVAIFIGCHALKSFRYILLIDDDCILPPHFPVVISRLTDGVRCIGYTIKSVSADSSKGSYCQQAQDLEYKLAGLQRSFAGLVGSATFPHGAISLWERSFLKDTLQHHPGFSISEDWFMGNSCRRLGGRIQMCSAVFVETTTPSALFFINRNKRRGGFGETTVFKQRFLRWNFFVANAIWYNLVYVFGSWRLGRWEIGTKLFVIQEVCSHLLSTYGPCGLESLICGVE